MILYARHDQEYRVWLKTALSKAEEHKKGKRKLDIWNISKLEAVQTETSSEYNYLGTQIN